VAAVLLLLPILGGCAVRTARAFHPLPIVPPPSSAAVAPPAVVPQPPSEEAQAYAHYATAVSMDFEAEGLEGLFQYRRLSSGARQPSLLREARSLRQAALSQLDEALKHDARSAPIVRRKGDVYFEMGRVDQALSLYKTAESGAQAPPRWYFRTAGRLEAANRLADAAGILDASFAAIRADQADMREAALVELGGIYARLNRYADAERYLRQAVREIKLYGVTPTSAVGAALRQNLESDPTAVSRMLVAVLKKEGKLDDALSEASAAAKDAPKDSRAMLALADVYEARGEHDLAAAAAGEFVDANPLDETGVVTLMRILAGQGKIDDAAERGKAHFAAGGKGEAVGRETVQVYARAGRPDDAERFVRERESRGIVDVPLEAALLDMYAGDKDAVKAFAAAERILLSKAVDVEADAQVFSSLWDGLSGQECDKFYVSYASRFPEDFAASYAYLRVLRSRGQVERAAQIAVELAGKGAPFGETYEMAAAYLIVRGEDLKAAEVFLSGVESGRVEHPESVTSALSEAAKDPKALAESLEKDAAKYPAAEITLDEIIARLYMRAGENAKAEEYYRKALAGASPQLADYVGLAITLYRQDKTADAIALVEDLRKKGQGVPPLLRMLASLLTEDKKYAEARRIADALIADQPTDVDNRLALASLLVDQEDYDAAERELVTAQSLAEGDEESMNRVRYLLGIVYEEEGKDALAVSMWRANLTVDPGDADSNNALGYHYADRRTNLKEAKALIEKALKEQPDSGAYLDSLGWVYYAMGDTGQAVEILTKAAAKRADPVIFDHLGDALWKSGDGNGALAAWQKALSSRPRAKDRARIEGKIRTNFPGVR